MAKLIYKSNGAAMGDGIRTMRISNGGQKIEMLVDDSDPFNPRWSEMKAVIDELDPQPEPEPELEPDPQPEPVSALVGQRVTILGA